ncbi:EI24 domain-containing protein [Marinifilum sp. D714]|uniref:EI24 domain-containing protein n=1 Tax=Marinifilum sp. D714 TaxID=2937523 RepID=UPI0027BD158A|nr:EI24 domain-containing protein [Marinifilum sp. D714]MDQ2178379.1 EI24 domain-containing protein [Marinifilum sp. D714]
MKLIKDFGFGLRTYSEALNYIFRKRLAWFFIFPLLLNIILFWVGWDYISSLSEQTQTYLQNWLDLENADFWGSGFLKATIGGFIWIVFKVLFFLIFAYFGGYIIIIIMSPVFSYLSERTEKIKTGNDYPFEFRQLLRDIIRGVFIAVRNLCIELLLTVLMFFLSFIPIIGWASAIMLFFISAYFYGFSFLDYAIERKRLSIKDSVQFMRENKGIVIANGFVFSLCLIVPFCGVSFSSFAAIISVVAGTLAVNEIWEKEKR